MGVEERKRPHQHHLHACVCAPFSVADKVLAWKPPLPFGACCFLMQAA